MPPFAENVFEIFNDLTNNHRFVPARAGADKNFASLVREEEEDVFVYVMVHDNRPGGGTVEVHVWVAPPESPDDTLDKLYVGYRIRIADEYDIDDEFFLNCQQRIVHFLPCVAAMVPLIREELVNPSFRTRRWIVYQLEQRAVARVLQLAESGETDAVSAVKAATRLALGRGSYSRFNSACAPIATVLLKDEKMDADILRFFKGNIDSLASTLSRFLYARALGELSRLQKAKRS